MQNAITTTAHREVPGARIGHVHLKVADLDRALGFYSDLLGFPVTQRYGAQAAFLGADGYHHHIGLNTWQSAGGSAPPKGHTGLFHTAFLYPSQHALAVVVSRLSEAGHLFTGANDHGVSIALFLDDPDGNGVELTWDRPQAEWPRDRDGALAMISRPFEVDAWLRDALSKPAPLDLAP